MLCLAIFIIHIYLALYEQVQEISLFHRAYFTYSLLIYPTNALHLKHSIVFALTTPTCFGRQARVQRMGKLPHSQDKGTNV
jgi:hypothetical protein